MNRLLILAGCLVGSSAWAFKMAGDGANAPTVQSAFDGTYYVRTVPAEALGDGGTTTVVRVGATDEVIDTYDVYMRGTLHLGWSPLAGKWTVAQVEPVRITSNDGYPDLGRVSKLAFYAGGEHLRTYSEEDLAALGLSRRVAHLDNGLPGQFVVLGVRQVPNTNDYRLAIEANAAAGKRMTVEFDIVTGDRVVK